MSIESFPISKDFIQTRTDEWISNNYDFTKLLNHNLTTDSVVMDLGGFCGKWSQRMLERYGCRLFVFEPIDEYYSSLLNTFYGTTVRVHNYGISDRNKHHKIYLSNDASSLYQENDSQKSMDIELRDIVCTIDEMGVDSIDLVNMNIEGSEYDVLDRLLDSDYIQRVKKIQVQFHTNLGRESYFRRLEIQKRLAKTHTMLYNSDFCWEAWQLNR